MIKLLLADDSATIQRVVELTFSGEDVQVIAVSDGEQAIARLSTERPDIVLADIGMPKKNGYDVAAYVKDHAELSTIPVILLAGAFEPVDEQLAKDVCSAGVLVKPFEPQQVIARVRELVDGGRQSPAAPVPMSAPQAKSPAPVVPFVAPTPPAPAPAPVPAPVAAPKPAVETSLDDYFDRLDAAFATLGGSSSDMPELPPIEELPSDPETPTMNDILGDAALRLTPGVPVLEFGGVKLPPLEPPDGTPLLTPAPSPQVQRAGSGGMADIFRVLLAIEQGDTTATLQLPAAARPAAARPVVTDDLVEEVTRRVLERLAPAAARDLVADIVSEVAERLVREEIQRIRNQQ